MKFDRDKFFSGFRQHFDDSLSQFQVDGINFLLTAFETDPAWKHLPHIAYALATIFHETAQTMQPITERGPRSYFDKYNAGTRIGKRLGNTEEGDGYKFRGRGYVQLTGRANYTREGIENAPEKALDPQTAFDIMTGGMFKGRYTGKKFSDYISDTGKDYKEARRIINGTDQAAKIANYANQFEAILRASKTNSAAAPPQISDSSVHPVEPTDAAAADITKVEVSPEGAVTVEKNDTQGAPPSPSSNDKPPDRQLLTKESPSTFVKWLTAIKVFFGMVIAGLTAWCQSNEAAQIIARKGAERATDSVDQSFLIQLGIVVLYTLIGVGGGVFLIYIASLFYDKSANRANTLNVKKVDAAEDTQKATVEFKQ